jgi:hypothetical protein
MKYLTKESKIAPDSRTLHITIVLIVGILVLAQGLLIYVILAQIPDIPILARPQACDSFELKSPNERAKCRPINYTPKNTIET